MTWRFWRRRLAEKPLSVQRYSQLALLNERHHAECSSQSGTGWCDCRGLPFKLRTQP